MPLRKVTIAIDSFKGSLTSREAAEVVESAIVDLLPDSLVQKVTIADGGEGTVEALVDALGGELVEVATKDPLGRPIVARYGVVENGKVAVIEVAAASGLTLLSPTERNPLSTSSLGTGEIIAHALSHGCRKFLVGIGGSATNDAGVGLCHALGFRFLDKRGNTVSPCGERLADIVAIDDSGAMEAIRESEFIVACDVASPLYGPHGAAYIFAPQKGASPEEVARLDEGLRSFGRLLNNYCGTDVASMEGAGAAGGIGAGLVALLGARLQSGVRMVMEALRFDHLIEGSDLIITGEGRIDQQTLMGKLPGGVLEVASAQGIPVVAVCGEVIWCKELSESGFAAILPITPPSTPLEKAVKPDVAKGNLRCTAQRIAESHYPLKK